ncbi:MAG TPA: polysaccharide deacetylase family protein, partial [Longimicrobiales bacterium]|nr:polysaccharide deacetylase family protein [Longimicrobiales bacterium]
MRGAEETLPIGRRALPRWALVGLSVGFAACADATGPSADEDPEPLPELMLSVASPSPLTAEVATEVPLAVRVETVGGAPFEGALVTWEVDVGSIVSAAATPTDATGRAGAVWLLGTTAGEQGARARVQSRDGTVTLDISATALAGPAVTASVRADSILLSGRGETALLRPSYADRFGNPAEPGGLSWISRDPSVVTVTAEGLVTGADAGGTYIVGSIDRQPVDSLLATVEMRGAITITFDDGFITAYTNAWPVFRELGLPGNVAVNPGQVGYPSYMTVAHLDELHAAGWSMVSHTMTHSSMPGLSDGELDDQLQASRDWLDGQGYNGSNVFIVPYHEWGARELAAVGRYHEAARGITAGFVVPDSLVSWMPSNPFGLTGIEGDELPFTSVEGRDRLRAFLQKTVDEGAFIDLFFHHLEAADVDAFRETLQVVAEFRDRVLPYHELFPRVARS